MVDENGDLQTDVPAHVHNEVDGTFGKEAF